MKTILAISIMVVLLGGAFACFMRLWRMIFVAGLALMLSSCAGGEGFFGGGDYAMYTGAHTDHATAEALRITKQSEAISTAAAVAKPSSATEAILLSVIAMQQISALHPTELKIAKPTTGYDVLDKLVGHVPLVATVGGMWQLGKVGIENAGQVVIGEGATVTDSLNRPSVSTIGSESGIDYQGTAEPTVVEPAIVMPEVVQPTIVQVPTTTP